MTGRGLGVLTLAGLALAATLAADEVNVYAAISLSDALKDLAPGFEAQSGHKVRFSLGASNDLARQIRVGAPADLFFSADEAQMEKLVSAGLVRAADRVDVLSNVLVIVVPSGSTGRMTEPRDLLAVMSLALADPRAVPAGVYARSWLQSIGLWDKLRGQVVPTLNVRAALSAVESGNAEAGVVYRTDAAQSKRARVALEVPPDQGPRIVYPLAPLAGSKKAATAQLLRYLVSPTARETYARRGFVVLPAR